MKIPAVALMLIVMRVDCADLAGVFPLLWAPHHASTCFGPVRGAGSGEPWVWMVRDEGTCSTRARAEADVGPTVTAPPCFGLGPLAAGQGRQLAAGTAQGVDAVVCFG